MKFRNIKTGNIIVASQEFIDNRVDSSDWELVPEVVITPTLEELKQQKIKQLQDKYQEEYDTYLAQYPQSEVATFEDKKREALAYDLDSASPTPILDNILLGYNGTVTKAEYVASILAKVNYLAQREGVMVAKRDAIKACTTQDELDAIEV